MTRRAVLFDLDDTLIPERHPEREAMSMSGRAAGLDDQDANRLPDVLEPIGRAHWNALDRDGVFKEVSYTWREALWGPPCDEIGASAALLAAYRDATWADTFRAMGLRDARVFVPNPLLPANRDVTVQAILQHRADLASPGMAIAISMGKRLYCPSDHDGIRLQETREPQQTAPHLFGKPH